MLIHHSPTASHRQCHLLILLTALIVACGVKAPRTDAAPASPEIALLQSDNKVVLVRGTQRQVVSSGGRDYTDIQLRWSPDGWHLAVQDGVLTFGADHNKVPAFAPSLGEGRVWSADGQRLAYIIGSGDDTNSPVIAGPDGDAATIMSYAHFMAPLRLDWSPDGRMLMAMDQPVATNYRNAKGWPYVSGSAWSPKGEYAGVELDYADRQLLIHINLKVGTRSIRMATVKMPSEVEPVAPFVNHPPTIHWLPDGNNLLVAVANPWFGKALGTWLVRRDGTYKKISPAVLTDLAADGQRMLARVTNPDIDYFEQSGMVVVRVPSGTVEQQLGPGYAAAWRPALRGNPPAAPLAAKSPTLQLRSPRIQGSAVREAQQLLKQQGVYSGPIDGVFGPGTQGAVRAFQAAEGGTVDGVIGPRTWSLLRWRALIQDD